MLKRNATCDVSAPYQQNNDEFAYKPRLDKHCSFKPVCNERTLYEREAVFETDDRGHVDVYEPAQNRNVGTSINSVAHRYISAKNGVENSTSTAPLNNESIFKIYL